MAPDAVIGMPLRQPIAAELEPTPGLSGLIRYRREVCVRAQVELVDVRE